MRKIFVLLAVIIISTSFSFAATVNVLETGGNPGQVNRNYGDQIRNQEIDRNYIQTVPEDLERERRRREQEEKLQRDVQRGNVIYNPKFRLKNFFFEGNTIYSDKKLRALGQNILHKEVYLEDVLDYAIVISRYYQKNGYLTTYAYIPPQEIEDGVVKIIIDESRVGVKKVRGNRWARTFYLKKIVLGGPNLSTNKVFNVRPLQGALKTLNKEAYIKTMAAIEKDKQENTVIELEVEDRFPLVLRMNWDDFGRDNIGRQRFSGILGSDNLTGFGDRIYGGPILASRTTAAVAGYQIPVSTYGTRLSFDYSYTNIRPGGELAPLQLQGKSTFYSLKLAQPLINNAVTDLEAYTAFDWIHVTTDLLALQANIADYALRVSRTGLNWMHDDKTGRWLGNTEASFGIGALGASSNIEGGPQSVFQRYIASLVRVERLPHNILGVVKVNGQYSPQSLFAAEQMYIGGPYSIWGFQPSELIGDYGVAGIAELRFPIPFFRKALPEKLKFIDDRVRLSVFYNWGYVRSHGNLTEAPKNFLHSTGFGSYLYLTDWLSAQLGVGFPLGSKFADQTSARMFFTINTELDRLFLKPKYHGMRD